MKVSVNWLKQFTDIDLPVDELVQKIGAQLGAVEEVIDLGQKYQGIIVARVVSCEKHPNADKLSVCLIDDGGKAQGVERDENGQVRVVCGAPNVRAGLFVAWLPPGATVPNSYDKEPFVLEARELRGVISNGMLASAHELAIGDDHNGIVELDADNIHPGDDFAEIFQLNDYIIDIENKMFTHRPDCFGMLGVAREIAGITGRQFTSPEWYLKVLHDVLAQDGDPLELTIKNGIPEAVPRFMALALSDIEIRPSPFWLQTYLSRVGIRPINNVVDITNYMMVLTAQPLHAYDANKLPAKSLETRLSKKGEKLKLLGGKQIEFDDESTILITSGDTPVGIGGVMGGADTEVDENTKSIILECANFDMYSVRRTSMKYGLFTDAVTRFSKGQSYLQNDIVLSKTVEMLRALAGGKVAGKPQDTAPDKSSLYWAGIDVAVDFINVRLGLSLSAEEMTRLLRNVEFDVAAGSTLTVSAPYWRTDIEIPEDIVEEVGRLYGYDKLPLVLPTRTIRPADPDKLFDLKARIRDVLSRAGANEVLTYSFVHGNLLDKVDQDKDRAFQLSNALSPELQYYRMSLTPSLLEKVHPNIKAGFGEFALFEIGKSHIKGEQDRVEAAVPMEFQAVSLVFAAGTKQAANHQGAAFYQAKHYLTALLEAFGTETAVSFVSLKDAKPSGDSVVAKTAAPYDPARSALVLNSDGQAFGVVGEFKASVARTLKLPRYAAGFEIGLHLLKGGDNPRYRPLSRFPKVQQDISLKVRSDLSYAELSSFVTGNLDTPENVVAELSPVDIYQKDDDKHITLRLTIVSYDRTMTDQEVNKLLDEVAKKAHDTFGAERL